MDQVRAYRGQILTFLEERDAFGSREWFNDDPGWRADLRDLPRFQGARLDRRREPESRLAGSNRAVTVCGRALCPRQPALCPLRRQVRYLNPP